MKIQELKIRKPNLNFNKSDVIAFLVTIVITGVIAGLISYTLIPLQYSVILSIVIGIILGFVVVFAKSRILMGVTYPSLKKLLELTVYVILTGAIVAVISLGLDLLFLRLRDMLL